MASLKDVARDEADIIREGIAWVVFYRTGRSWNSTSIWLDCLTDTIEPDDMESLTAILKLDPEAVALNGYFCGRLGEDMTISQIAAGVRWHYENGHNLLSEFVEAYHPPVIAPRPADLPAELPWSGLPIINPCNDIFDPCIYDGSMSVEDYELMHGQIEADSAQARSQSATRFSITRKELLCEIQDRLWNDVFCYSDNYGMTRPKDGYADEWEQALAKAELIGQMIDELQDAEDVPRARNGCNEHASLENEVSDAMNGKKTKAAGRVLKAVV